MEVILRLKEGVDLSDKDVIGDLFQAMDEGAEFVSTRDNYVWFYLIGKHFRPKVICEMGTRFGYSMKAFTDGAGHSPGEFELHTFDVECDGIKTLHIFEDYFRRVKGIQNLNITRIDTQTIETLGLDGRCDLCLVDARHTTEGCFHECNMAWAALKSGGVMVIDDINFDEPQRGLERFCLHMGLRYEFIPSFRGIALVVKP
jgi:predicted O-methyltransferase YrrM